MTKIIRSQLLSRIIIINPRDKQEQIENTAKLDGWDSLSNLNPTLKVVSATATMDHCKYTLESTLLGKLIGQTPLQQRLARAFQNT